MKKAGRKGSDCQRIAMKGQGVSEGGREREREREWDQTISMTAHTPQAT